jgi:hypothetical protein
VEDESLGNEDEEEHVPEENIVRTVDMHHDDAGKRTVVSWLQPVRGRERGVHSEAGGDSLVVGT